MNFCKNLSFVFLLIIFISSCVVNRSFPKFVYISSDGKRISNEFFKHKKTIVLTGHLTCPGMFYALKDFETLDTSNFQLLVILENTPQHIQKFNGKDSVWSEIRQAFKMKPIHGNILCECDKENIKYKRNKVIIGKHCWKISRKLFTLNSPNIYYVNTFGKIYKHVSGYWLYPTQFESQKRLLNDK